MEKIMNIEEEVVKRVAERTSKAYISLVQQQIQIEAQLDVANQVIEMYSKQIEQLKTEIMKHEDDKEQSTERKTKSSK
jgi:hypothetical protein